MNKKEPKKIPLTSPGQPKTIEEPVKRPLLPKND
tara:strand:- start:2377 stop:2478 length:102 start_codon:yes stop_codon:yes gene_type:complete